MEGVRGEGGEGFRGKWMKAEGDSADSLSKKYGY